MSAAITSPFHSVPEMFTHRVEETPEHEAYRYPDGATWQSLTWAETRDRVRAIALGLHALGIDTEDRVAVVSSTRVEWILADLGILCAGGATTTIYPASTPDDCTYILNDSGSRVIFAENQEQIDKLKPHRAELADVIKVITFDGATDGDWVLGLDELEELGRDAAQTRPELFEELTGKVQADHLATLIYTSGTTGRPKGVLLTHANWLYEAEAVKSMDQDLLSVDDLQYLWLPLAHVFGKFLQVGQLRIGFPTAVDGDVTRLVDNLAVVAPTFMAAAPRIFEKVYNKVVTQARSGGKLKYGIFRWACGVGKKVSRLRQRGEQPAGLLALQYALADKLLFGKLRGMFGGRLRYFASGSAPLSIDIAEFFHAMGIPILEGYGLTESSAATTVSLPSDFRIGTVGKPVGGTEIRFLDDGEILLRGGGIMRGYHNLAEETAAALDEDGWFHTGDIGVLEDGFLRITDRKKDLIKTAGGKYVAPQSIEGQLKALCPYISNVVLHGDKRAYCVALVTLDPETVAQWANENGVGELAYEQLSKHPTVRELIDDSVRELNSTLARHETIKSFAILPRDLTVEEGELTPSLKVKRRVVEQHYSEVLDELYPAVHQKL